jgi:hypothetical protein
MNKKIAVFKQFTNSYIINLGDKDIKIKKDELSKYKDEYTFIYANTRRDPIKVTDENGDKKALTELKDILNFYNECQSQLTKATKGFLDFNKSPSMTRMALFLWSVFKKESTD